MAFDASELLGEPQVVGTTVNPRGFGKRKGLQQVGLVGEAMLAASRKSPTAETPAFGRIAYLAVTERDVALIKIELGAVKGKLAEVLARVPRSEIASADVGGGMLNPPVTIAFRDGGSWQFEVSRLVKKGAQSVVNVLAAAPA